MGAASKKKTKAGFCLGPRWLRAGFALGAVLSRPLAARAAEQLFLRPPRRRGSASERAAGALAEGEALEIPVQGFRVRAWRFGVGPPVLLVHGFGGSAAEMAPLIRPLVAEGCQAVAFDAPAHGESTGRLASGATFAAAVSAVAASVGARAAVGHSLGGSAIAFALAGGLGLRNAVLLSPPRSAAPFFRRFCEALALSSPLEEALRGRIRARHGLAPEEFEVARGPAAGSIPLLVIHDRGDREVPFAQGEAVAARLGAELVATSGLGHRRILLDPAIGSRVAAFVAAHLPRCPCGRLAELELAFTGPVCEPCALDREMFRRDLRSHPAVPGEGSPASAA